MNSFRFIERGIEAEIERQIEIWESGGEVVRRDAALRSRRAARSRRCAPRRRCTTTATSPSPTWCRSLPSRQLIERAARGAARAADRAARALRVRVRGRRRRRRDARQPAGAGRVLRAGGGRRRIGRRRARWRSGRPASWSRACAIRRQSTTRRDRAVAGGAGRAGRDGPGEGDLAERPPSRCWRSWSKGGEPRAIVDALGLGAIGDSNELDVDRRRCLEGQPGRGREDQAGQAPGDGRDRRRCHEGDERTRRRCRSQSPHQGKARRLGPRRCSASRSWRCCAVLGLRHERAEASELPRLSPRHRLLRVHQGAGADRPCRHGAGLGRSVHAAHLPIAKAGAQGRVHAGRRAGAGGGAVRSRHRSSSSATRSAARTSCCSTSAARADPGCCAARASKAGGSETSMRPMKACASAIGPRRRFYTTWDSAQDIEAVRRALGIGKITLIGVSYGTKLAETYARLYPSSVDTAGARLGRQRRWARSLAAFLAGRDPARADRAVRRQGLPRRDARPQRRPGQSSSVGSPTPRSRAP